jgi:hypothetical protein
MVTTACSAGSAIVARPATVPTVVLVARNGEPRPLSIDREVTVVEILDEPTTYSTDSAVSLTCQPWADVPTGLHWLPSLVAMVVLVAIVCAAGARIVRSVDR